MKKQSFAVQFEPGSLAIVFSHGGDATDKGGLGWSGDEGGEMMGICDRLQRPMGMNQAGQYEKWQGCKRPEPIADDQRQQHASRHQAKANGRCRQFRQGTIEPESATGPNEVTKDNADQQIVGAESDQPVHCLPINRRIAQQVVDDLQVSADNPPVALHILPTGFGHRSPQGCIGQDLLQFFLQFQR